ncbi:SRPBCC domain-containing protein [Nocardiopsis lambiniae]|uniref:SRPBCC domain-containing protein n=1 Tax=Nocardiopsis lambiniae TaxID=3075539 RepID=A0ABU2MA75_9ACTN|nr:SRPBCC domain-containing protein [Nocardiopsis sp. DSM 44743]MDT0329473.1 SRPBCC domain-containing protein [Nocardiopsis sp. DSM 44743]
MSVEPVAPPEERPRPESGPPGGPEFAHEILEFPPLGSSGGHPVAHRRWEELVSDIHIRGHGLDDVWNALTDPYAIAQWFADADEFWAAPGRESALDFNDGEFFWCRTVAAEPPHEGRALLEHLWRWVGVGPATTVRWELSEPTGGVVRVRVVERATNPPSDWRSWNGMGWPGILDQLAEHLRTGRRQRWPWRRMGPYVQTELPLGTFEAWSTLTSIPALQFWLGRSSGTLVEGDRVDFTIGDASGTASLAVTRHVEANQSFPSFQPRLEFTLHRLGWPGPLDGHLWIEPAGLGRSVLQVFHSGWERFGQLAEAPVDRALLTAFWASAFGRLVLLMGGPPGEAPGSGTDGPGPHAWSR